VGTVYQSQDRQEELQRSVPQVLAPMQAELPGDGDFLSKIQAQLGAKKHPGFTRKRGKRGTHAATPTHIQTPLRAQEKGQNRPEYATLDMRCTKRWIENKICKRTALPKFHPFG
jgi:hypothetical protein